MQRKDFLKRLGAIAVGSTLLGADKALASVSPSEAPADKPEYINLPPRSLAPDEGRQVTVAVIGAGSRGNTYSRYSKMFPNAMRMVAVSDINPERKKAFGDRYGIPEELRFGDFHEFFLHEKMADAVIISTPDNLHYEPCMKALEMGYHVLLEKPVAQTEKQCRDIVAQARKYNRIVGVCHVLRYAPYFQALHSVLRSGEIGDIVSIQHMEPIQYAHMAHSYVRGNWRSSEQTTPIILAKSCHDLDIIRWLLDKPCRTVSADGSLFLFKEENAPSGAPFRCTDGCPHESTCPYSAIDIYLRRKRHLHVFDLKDRNDDDAIMEKLRTTGYGRCVFHCDNNQPDHYVADMVFDGGVTAAFSMEAFAPHGGRRTRVMGTKGYIEGDMTRFTVYDFRSSRTKIWDKKVQEVADYRNSGHGGGDMALARDFVSAVAHEDPSRLLSTVDVSLESHIMGFAAERSRKSSRKITIK